MLAGNGGWAIPANYPELANGEILRLDWFILFFEFITIVIVCIVSSIGAIPQVQENPQNASRMRIASADSDRGIRKM